jgi:dihydrofolate reductase
MRRVKLYIAMSLNGKIARKDGSVDWLESLPNPDHCDHGYSDFYDSIDTTIQGYTTYKQILEWGIEFPYAGKKNYVITRRRGMQSTEYVEFLSENHLDFVKQLKKQEGGDIWLIGGGETNTMLLEVGLIDELQVFVMPVLIPHGIELFKSLPGDFRLELVDSKSYSTGAMELRYTTH